MAGEPARRKRGPGPTRAHPHDTHDLDRLASAARGDDRLVRAPGEDVSPNGDVGGSRSAMPTAWMGRTGTPPAGLLSSVMPPFAPGNPWSAPDNVHPSNAG